MSGLLNGKASYYISVSNHRSGVADVTSKRRAPSQKLVSGDGESRQLSLGIWTRFGCLSPSNTCNEHKLGGWLKDNWWSGRQVPLSGGREVSGLRQDNNKMSMTLGA